MKWAHSIRSGSSFEIRGEETSPERAMYSPYERVVLVEALVVDGELPLQLHVVERGHPPGADHREAALLVRVQP